MKARLVTLDEIEVEERSVLFQLFPARILYARSGLMVGSVKQHLVQAAPIEHFATFLTPSEMLLFLRRKLFVFVERHMNSPLAVNRARGIAYRHFIEFQSLDLSLEIFPPYPPHRK